MVLYVTNISAFIDKHERLSNTRKWLEYVQIDPTQACDYNFMSFLCNPREYHCG